MSAPLSTPLRACDHLTQSRERIHLALTRQGAVLGYTQGDQLPLPNGLGLTCQVAQLALQPMAQQHPFKLVAGAAAVGGLLVLARPWRWASLPPALTGLLLPLLSELVRHQHGPTPSKCTQAP